MLRAAIPEKLSEIRKNIKTKVKKIVYSIYYYSGVQKKLKALCVFLFSNLHATTVEKLLSLPLFTIFLLWNV